MTLQLSTAWHRQPDDEAAGSPETPEDEATLSRIAVNVDRIRLTQPLPRPARERPGDRPAPRPARGGAGYAETRPTAAPEGRPARRRVAGGRNRARSGERPTNERAAGPPAAKRHGFTPATTHGPRSPGPDGSAPTVEPSGQMER